MRDFAIAQFDFTDVFVDSEDFMALVCKFFSQGGAILSKSDYYEFHCIKVLVYQNTLTGIPVITGVQTSEEAIRIDSILTLPVNMVKTKVI